MNNREVSAAVIIVNYNSSDWLARCIKGLQQQTLVPRRIIIVDNHSQDESLLALSGLDSCIEVHKLDVNIGFAAANNYAIGLDLDCRWVVLLNPDAIPEPSWLESLVEYADSHADCAAVGSLMIDAVDTSRLDGIGDAYHGSGLAWRLGYGMPVDSWKTLNTPVFSPCAAAALYNLEVVRQLGGFEESFFCYYEDVDLGFRIRLAGYDCGVQRSAVVYHAGSATTAKRSDFSTYHGHRNMVWAYVRNMPGYLFWLYLPQHIILNVLFMLLGIWRGQGAVVWKAKMDALKGVPVALQQRREIQRNRVVPVSKIWQAMTGSAFDWFRSRKY